MSINWERHFRDVYSRHLPARLDDIPLLLARFAGFEEAFWLATCKRFNEPPSQVVIAPLTVAKSAGLRQRVIHMYARYAPYKCRDVDSTMDLMEKEGAGRVFALLVKKYGEEPLSNHVMDMRERITVLMATYGKYDEIAGIDKMMLLYRDMEEILLRRLICELGPEPHAENSEDPRDPRQRLRRIFVVYEPSLLTQVELVLARYEGRHVQMFATMQRRYGREPSPLDVTTVLAAKEADLADKKRRAMADDPPRLSALRGPQPQPPQEPSPQRAAAVPAQRPPAGSGKGLAETTTTGGAAAARKWKQKDPVWDPVSLRDLPHDAPRDQAIMRVRNHMVYEDQLSYEKSLEVAVAVFRAYDRDHISNAEAFVRKRFGNALEGAELLSFLDCSYANAVPVEFVPHLRTIVSLLAIKLGNSFDEVWNAGGVEDFLSRIDPRSASEWAVYLLMSKGKVTEDELATRNRLRAHYLYYNADVPVAEVDRILAAFDTHEGTLHDAMLLHYGPEPAPLRIDLQRVVRLLVRHAPARVSDVATVIEAHTEVGDTAEQVIKKIARTYGPEPTESDALFDELIAKELEQRFFLYVQQLRLFTIFMRRSEASFTLAENDPASSPAQLTAARLGIALERIMQESARKNAASATARKDDDIVEDIGNVFRIEERLRRQLLDAERQAWIEMLDSSAALAIDAWDEDRCAELAEGLRREVIIDNMMVFFIDLKVAQIRDKAEIYRWLSDRLLWREKWAKDVKESSERAAREAEAKLLKDANDRRVAALLEEANQHRTVDVGMEHLAHMQDMYDALNTQARRVLNFDVAVSLHQKNSNLKRALSTVAPSRATHAGCVFQHDEYTVRVPLPSEDINSATRSIVAGTEASALNRSFRDAVAEYLSLLFERHDPVRLATLPQLIAQYEGRESHLLTALEQQYGLAGGVRVGEILRTKLHDYYRIMAPGREEEIDVLLQKFKYREEQVWQFVTARYGPIPALQSESLRQYLKARLVRYLAMRCPQLLPDVDAMVARCTDNGDNVFCTLTREFGPEDPDAQRDALERKLRAFYRRRGLRRAIDTCAVIAARFVGREALLNELLSVKFGDTLVGEMPDLAVATTQPQPLPPPTAVSAVVLAAPSLAAPSLAAAAAAPTNPQDRKGSPAVAAPQPQQLASAAPPPPPPAMTAAATRSAGVSNTPATPSSPPPPRNPPVTAKTSSSAAAATLPPASTAVAAAVAAGGTLPQQAQRAPSGTAASKQLAQPASAAAFR